MDAPDAWETDAKLASIRKVRGYSYTVRRGRGQAAVSFKLQTRRSMATATTNERLLTPPPPESQKKNHKNKNHKNKNHKTKTTQEIVDIRRDTLPDYDAKINAFYQEHIHADDEIRYVLGGRGYFDVRDARDRWVRISCGRGDLIVLPEGIYHRFTLDAGDHVRAMRLFVGAPVWTPINRGPDADGHAARGAYKAAFLKGAVPAAA